MATKNPLYPGYHPGEKIERYPSSRYREYKGEYAPSKFNEYLEKLGDGEGFNIPKWLWESEKAGLDLNWKANYYGGAGIDPAQAAVEGEEEIEDIPGGVIVGPTLNPVEWVKDPKKQLRNAVIKPVESIFDRSDFYRKAKEKVWRTKLMADGEEDRESPFHLLDGPQVVGKLSYQNKPEETVGFDMGELIKPDFEKQPGIYSDKLYKETARSVPEFMERSHLAFDRNNKLNDFNKKVLANLDTEFEIKLDEFSPEHQQKIKDFKNRVRIIDAFDDMGVVGGTGKKKTVFAQTVEGSKKILELELGSSDKKSIKKSLKDVLDEYDRSFFKGNITGDERDTINIQLKKLKDSVGHAQKLIDDLGNPKDLSGLKKYVDSLDKKLSKAFVLKDGEPAVKENLGKGFFRDLKVHGSGLYRNTPDGGAVGGYLRKFVQENITNSGSELNSILKAKDESTNTRIMSSAASRLSTVSNAVMRDWEWNTAADIADWITQGKLPTNFIYLNVIQPRIERWTPSYIVGQTLKRSHYFGLLVTEDALGDNPKLKPTFIGKFLEKHPRLPFNTIKENKFSITVGDITKEFVGGKDFESVIAVAKLFGKTKNGKFSFNQTALLKFLNGESIAGFTQEDYEALEKFKELLLRSPKLKALLGLTKDPSTKKYVFKTAEEFFSNFVGKRFKKLGIDPTLSKTGIVQRYGVFLGNIQEWFYSSLPGRLYQSIKGWQIILRERISEALSSLIAKVFGAVTGPIGWAFGWLVKIISQVVVKRIEQFVSKFWKALKSFDFSEVFEDIEESFYKGIKGCLIFSSFTVLPVVGIVLFIVISIVSIFPNFNAGRIGVDQTGMGILFNRDFFMANCGDEVELPSEAIGANNSSSSVARAAFDIVEDLERGFWCYFNKSPDYPELFRDTLFSINPFPPASVASNTWNLLFWCTFLPWKSGADIPPDQYCYNPSTGDAVSRYRADGMQYCYQNAPGNRYVSADEAYVTSSGGNVQSNIFAGDVIFINSGDSTRPSNHVGLVYEVTPDYIISVQSNTGLKVWHYPVADDGGILGAFSHRIVGFGR